MLAVCCHLSCHCVQPEHLHLSPQEKWTMSFQSLELSPNLGRNEILWHYLWDVSELHYFILARMCSENHSSCTCPVQDFSRIFTFIENNLWANKLYVMSVPMSIFFMLADSTHTSFFLTHTHKLFTYCIDASLRVKRIQGIWANFTIKAANLLTYMWPKTTS